MLIDFLTILPAARVESEGIPLMERIPELLEQYAGDWDGDLTRIYSEFSD